MIKIISNGTDWLILTSLLVVTFKYAYCSTFKHDYSDISLSLLYKRIFIISISHTLLWNVVWWLSFLCFCTFLQEHAFESSQKYKEGKFIIELAHMIKDNGWEWRSGPCSCLSLTLECSLSNCVEHRPPCPSRTSPHPLLQLLPYKKHPQNLHTFASLHMHTPTGSPWNGTEQMTSTTTTRKWSNCLKITSQESCRYFKDCVFSFAAPELSGLTPPTLTTPPPPPPPNHAYKWLWWYGDH